jgi:hypothetical protein
MNKILYAFTVSHACYLLHLSHPPGFENLNKVQLRVQIMKLLNMQFSSSCCYFPHLRSYYSVRILFSDTVSLCCCIRVRDQVSARKSPQILLSFTQI